MNVKKFSKILLISVIVAVLIGGNIILWQKLNRLNQHQQEKTQAALQNLTTQLTQLQQNLSTLQNKVTALSRHNNISATLQTLNEIAYLIDSANLYLQVTRDVTSAIKSLQLAQSQLQTLNNPNLLPLNQALSNDLNHLHNIPKIDLEKLLIRLQTLQISIENLTFLPRTGTNTTALETTAEKNFLARGWEKFKSLFIIQYHPENNTPILSPDQRELIRENIIFEIKLAQWSLLQKNSSLYQQSFMQIQTGLLNYYPNTAARKTILDQVNELMTINISPDIPTIDASLQAVHQALNQITLITETQQQNKPTITPNQEKNLPPVPTGIEI